MRKKVLSLALFVLLLTTYAMTAYALPKPRSAHYPRGGELTLSTTTNENNTYAFKANGRHDEKLHIQFTNAYADQCDTNVSVQVFVVNKWGNWVAFGNPKMITLSCMPEVYDLHFPIRIGKEFCIVVSAYGITGNAILPYILSTY